jgi:sterol desaturase/sphingolipid hydroxylase (fatty acid hydroxylase superfamily)
MAVGAWKQFIPWYLYTAVLLCLGFFAAGQGLSVWTVGLLLGAGFLSWGVIEYVLHRFIFHYDARSRLGRKILYYAHVSHHENPEARSQHFASLVLSSPVAAVYWLLAWAATGSWPVASFLLIGMASGYLYYQWIHFQCHHGKSRIGVLRYLRRYHLLHHHQTPELRFGVTSPVLDLVFGTFRPVVNRARRSS